MGISVANMASHFRLTDWARCIAVHNSGRRIAICQKNDCIRIFYCESDRSPITLKHHYQHNVTDMAWK